MSGETSPRSGKSGGIIVAVVVGGSAVGVIGWYLLTNRSGPAIDASGFDLSNAPESRRPVIAAAPSAATGTQPQSSLGMMKADAGIRIVDSNSSSGQGPAGSPSGSGSSSAAATTPEQKKAEARAAFTEKSRQHEAEVRKYAEKMTAKYAVIRQYGRDWMSYPDLRKLNDDFMRTKDPVAFMIGLSRSKNLGAMIQKYAGKPEIREFIVDGMKHAPGELTSSAMDVLANDKVMKDLVGNIVSNLGLPPSITGMISSAGGGDPSKIDSNKMMGDIMNDPTMKKAMSGQGNAPPPVSLPNR